jgi:hypothetical protein
MAKTSREQLAAYLDDALDEGSTAEVERELRESEALRRQLRALLQERDRGDHSLGAVWRGNHTSCPSREQLGSFLLQVLESGLQDYIQFHLKSIGCPYCQANLTDLQALQQAGAPPAQARRRRFFESSAGLLRQCRSARP